MSIGDSKRIGSFIGRTPVSSRNGRSVAPADSLISPIKLTRGARQRIDQLVFDIARDRGVRLPLGNG